MAQIWLMKSEPELFSIDDLKQKGRSLWDGVRNFQARNFMTQKMRVGDPILFYHSNAEPPGIAGLARVSGPAVADPTQFNRESKYFEPRSTPSHPVWFCVEVEYVSHLPRFVSLAELKDQPNLRSMPLLQKGQRLSIQPVSEREYRMIQKLANIP